MTDSRIDPVTVDGNLKDIVRVHTKQLEREVILQKLKDADGTSPTPRRSSESRGRAYS